MLDNLKMSEDVAEEKDSLGGAQVHESAIYPVVVERAYLMKSKGEATGVVVNFVNPDGIKHSETFWVASGKAKGHKNYYVNKSGQKHYLPGFNQVNALAKLTVGLELGALTPETKSIMLWSQELGKEAPTEVAMLTELMGQEVFIGLLKIRTNKQKLNEATSKYEDTAEERNYNEVDKFFNTDQLTIQEVKAQATDPIFFDKWADKWKGEMKDTFKAVAGGIQSGSPSAGAGTKAPTKSLFNKKDQ